MRRVPGGLLVAPLRTLCEACVGGWKMLKGGLILGVDPGSPPLLASPRSLWDRGGRSIRYTLGCPVFSFDATVQALLH